MNAFFVNTWDLVGCRCTRIAAMRHSVFVNRRACVCVPPLRSLSFYKFYFLLAGWCWLRNAEHGNSSISTTLRNRNNKSTACVCTGHDTDSIRCRHFHASTSPIVCIFYILLSISTKKKRHLGIMKPRRERKGH